MINSVYGKTMENLRNRISVQLINNAKDFLRFTNRPTYIACKMFSENYKVIHEIKSVLMLNEPFYIRFAVLELSKWLTYHFHYNFSKKN